jgi:uncharacterized Ntn-hydrolase superfamily protein
MNAALPILILTFAAVSVSWAKDGPAQSSEPAAAEHSDLRIQDLPKPIPELLEKLQQLSRKLEPEIAKLGSTLGDELEQTVKQLREELKGARRGKSD